MDEAVVEDQRSDQSPSSGPEAEIQSTLSDVDQEQQQKWQEPEDGGSDLDLEGKTSHQEQKVRSSCFSKYFSHLLEFYKCNSESHSEKHLCNIYSYLVNATFKSSQCSTKK